MRNAKRLETELLTALDKHNLQLALRNAMEMLGELRTSELSPQQYYELFMRVTDTLRKLEAYFADEVEKSRLAVASLYENVQHAGSILPRLYLLITVGSVYIRSKKAPAKDVLFDLVELCRGVQHPLRGLFVRNFLMQVTRDKLPDKDSEYEGTGGVVADAIEFILQNFCEMNKLWVRMQHQGSLRNLGRREQERKNLRQLVGTTLHRLSGLEGVTLGIYKQTVLPKILEQTINCKDSIAQEYLMECIIQVFPDEYHVHCLERYLKAIALLKKRVNVIHILISLVTRLAAFARDKRHRVREHADIFALFQRHSAALLRKKANVIPVAECLTLQLALLKFTINCYPDRLDYIDSIHLFTADYLSREGRNSGTRESNQHERDAKTGSRHSMHAYKSSSGLGLDTTSQLLLIPLQQLNMRVLELKHFHDLMECLPITARRNLSMQICEAFLRNGAPVDNVQSLTTLFRYIQTSLRDETEVKSSTDDNAAAGAAQAKLLDREQTLVAKILHLIRHDDTDTHFALLTKCRAVFGRGGLERIRYTIPSLVCNALSLATRVVARAKAYKAAVAEEGDDAKSQTRGPKKPKVTPKKVFVFVHQTLVSAYTTAYPLQAMHLFILGAKLADHFNAEAVAYEFFAQAFLAYEDEIIDSTDQSVAIQTIVSALSNTRSFQRENWDALVLKCTQFSAKLLRKEDKSRAVANCAHLFARCGVESKTDPKGAKQVLKCLQRALKAANDCMESQVRLFVEILNKYLFFFDQKVPSIGAKYITGLICLVEEHLDTLEANKDGMAVRKYYENTLLHIRRKKTAATDERYLDIEVDAHIEALLSGRVRAVAATSDD